MREASMAEVNNHGVMLNDECSSQEANRVLLAQFARGAMHDTSHIHMNRDDEDDELGDEEEEELDEEERSEGNASKNGGDRSSSLKEQVDELKNNMTYISHQVTLLMNALHVPACKCEICKPRYQLQVELFTKMKEVGAEAALPKPEQKIERKKAELVENGQPQSQPQPVPQPHPQLQPQRSKVEVLPSRSSNGGAPFPGMPNMNDCEALLSQIFTQSGMGALSETNLAELTTALLNASPPKPFTAVPAAASSYPSPNPGGRKSKYCSPAEKKAVAEYANMHGASAAARKFNIPPPVAAYYHRKEYKQGKTPVPQLPAQVHSTVGVDSPGTTSGDDLESSNGDWINGQSSTISAAAPMSGVSDMFKHMEQHQKSNPAHSSGSPGFLRGRGRGRPKLIGDELDAELVDYMVQVKQSDPRGHLTASQALAIARDYILEKAPGLLEEHGGQIKLKLTWAMKLVSRISERQREIELGLPAGTISNMTRTISGSAMNLPGGNFMADMMAQNLLSQHMTQIMNQAISGVEGSVSATPQILNVRELELPKHDDSEKGEIVGGGDLGHEGECKQEDEEGQYDDDMDSQASTGENHVHLNEQPSVQQHFISTNAF